MSTDVKIPMKVALCGLLLAALGAVDRPLAAPLLVHFQGRVTDPSGVPLTSAQTVRVSLIQGGTPNEASTSGVVVYQEDAVIDPDDSGVFAHVLGSGSPVASHVLEESDVAADGQPVYVELSVAGTIVLPRTQITSAGYAIDASRLNGRTAADLDSEPNGNPLANRIVRIGAELEWVADTIRVKPGVLGFSDGVVRENTTERIWSFANGVGVLGLDAGTEQPSTIYYLYAIPDPGDDTQFSVVGSTAAPSQVGGSGPVGHPVHRFIGSFLNNSGANIEIFYRSGSDVFWRGRVVLVVNYCGAPIATVDAWVPVDISAYQPETSRAVTLDGYYDAWGSAVVNVYLIPESGAPLVRSCVDWQSGVASCDVTLPTVNRQFLYFADINDPQNNDDLQCLQFHLRGYREDLTEF